VPHLAKAKPSARTSRAQRVPAPREGEAERSHLARAARDRTSRGEAARR